LKLGLRKRLRMSTPFPPRSMAEVFSIKTQSGSPRRALGN